MPSLPIFSPERTRTLASQRLESGHLGRCRSTVCPSVSTSNKLSVPLHSISEAGCATLPGSNERAEAKPTIASQAPGPSTANQFNHQRQHRVVVSHCRHFTGPHSVLRATKQRGLRDDWRRRRRRRGRSMHACRVASSPNEAHCTAPCSSGVPRATGHPSTLHPADTPVLGHCDFGRHSATPVGLLLHAACQVPRRAGQVHVDRPSPTDYERHLVPVGVFQGLRR